MLHDDDLDAAVGATIVTQAQVDALREFAAKRRSTGVAERADEERFRFMRGFNDIFFTIGVVLFGVGVSIFAAIQGVPAFYALAAVIMWGLAELLVRRMRLVLPGIAVLIFFVMFVISAVPIVYLPVGGADATAIDWSRARPSMIGGLLLSGSPLQMAIKAVIGAVAAAGFYARFRFPFALLVIAGGAVIAVEYVAGTVVDTTGISRTALLLLCGAVVFGFAMWFDLSDRLRVTRWSDCAFWLHVLAAPLIVHSLIGLAAGPTFNPGNGVLVTVTVIAILLTVIALIIDRRALLVSALVYVGGVIAVALSKAILNPTLTLIATLVVLGVLVLALGVGWAALRRRILSLVPSHFVDRLPPVVPA
jgi:hypothetical protein